MKLPKIPTFISKRLLGLGFIAAGLLAILASFVNDWLGAGQFQGVGPTQRLVLLAAGAVILLGLTLLPLGDRPA